MKKSVITSVFVLMCGLLMSQNYTLSEIVGGKYRPKGVAQFVSSSDGKYFYESDALNTSVIKYSFATGEAVDTLFSTQTARNCNFDTFQGFMVSPDENRVLVYRDREQIYRHSYRATYYYHDVRRNLVRKLSEQTSKQMVPTFSPDSKMVAYVIDNNIWLTKFDFDTESQVTKDGEFGKVINGATDWVYEEEFAETKLMEFSPDSRLLAFVRFDESAVKEFSFQTFNEAMYPGYYSFKYPKAGEVNSKVNCRVFDVESRVLKDMDLPLDDDSYIPRIKFTNSSEELAVMTLNRNQTRFDMYYVNPRSTVSKLILREERDFYIDSDWLKSITFFNDKFCFISGRDGYSHIYIYGKTGTLQKQLTNGNYDVTMLLGVDASSETLFYQAADDSPMNRNIYKVDIASGKSQKLSTNIGFNTASFSENGQYYVLTYSNEFTPSVVTLHDSKGKQLRVLEDNADVAKSINAAGFPKKESLNVTAADGITKLNGWILKPANFNPNKRYPVVLVQYSGPNSQQVINRFNIDWYYALLKEDILVACVDGRGTAARGEAFRNSTYMKLGIYESDDQIATAKYLASLPYVDGEKIGIWGWSYGGYNVLMSMSRGNGTIKAGVAIAPVTDWRFYDTVYTERFMRTPQQNNQGYKNASAIELAGQLQGDLLIIHGTSDDNVHLQNTIEYSRALIENNKHFDLFLFPDKNHSILGERSRFYLYSKVIDYFKDKLN
ncbi:MAG: S9 family peptidase [Fermentimonas sp.]|jgi:dipeptidyl-peptidase-4